jgi:hypothetical protein
MAKRSLNRDEILDAIKQTASELKKTPSRSMFIGHTGIRENQVLKFFPNWNSAVKAAGLEPDTTNVLIDDDKLLTDWGMLVRDMRQIPTRVQYQHKGKFSTGTFEHHFGPWSSLPDKFREFAKDKHELSDVLALLPVTRSKSFIVEKNIKEENISNHSSFKQKHTKLDNRPIYGNHIDFRGLRHEPVNENGVIFLFGIVARELGYSVEAVQAGFPDCEAKRQVTHGKWQRVQIEFEFESRNFRDHGHPAEHCDVIVCWRHNWTDCPSHIEVVELSEIIKQLAQSDE